MELYLGTGLRTQPYNGRVALFIYSQSCNIVRLWLWNLSSYINTKQFKFTVQLIYLVPTKHQNWISESGIVSRDSYFSWFCHPTPLSSWVKTTNTFVTVQPRTAQVELQTVKTPLSFPALKHWLWNKIFNLPPLPPVRCRVTFFTIVSRTMVSLRELHPVAFEGKVRGTNTYPYVPTYRTANGKEVEVQCSVVPYI